MIRITAHAKVNFFLEITGKRPDGYHTLSTVFQTVSLGDVLTFSPASSLTLSCSDPRLPVDKTNLVVRGALRLQEALQETRGAQIHLEKIVPMGAGLGGGSADAAATLQGLLKLWDKNIEEQELQKIAVGLGADVPFFLKGGLCSATGIGEILQPMKPLPETWMVIVWPGFGISTKEAYAKVSLPLPVPQIHRHPDPRMCLYNRFESLVFPERPALPKLKQDFLDAGAQAALMSGSGSAVFGLVNSKQHGQDVLAELQKKYNHAWLVSAI
jgi:4-diphosphocytidyl-2-C-methyl-D-erythritol kinase